MILGEDTSTVFPTMDLNWSPLNNTGCQVVDPDGECFVPEVGQIMGLHPDAVRRRVAKALGSIRQSLKSRRRKCLT